MNRIGNGPSRILAAIAALLIIIGGIATALAQALGPAGPSPAGDHAEVVTQAMVDLPEGDMVWRIRNVEVDDATPAIVNDYPAFVTTEGVAVMVADEERGFRQRVAAGEATVLVPDHEMSIRSLGPRQRVLVLDVLPVGAAALSGSPGSISSAFPMEAGAYDVDLVRISLDEEDASSAVPLGNGPAMLITRSGQASIEADDSSFNLAAGNHQMADGDLTITALTDATVVLVARIGPRVESSEATPALPATPAPATPTVPATPAPATPTVPATPAPITPVTATPLPSTPDASPDATPTDVDSDGDGIVNSDEIGMGLDPDNPDTDGDGLSDGEELELGTDPLVADTDEDGIDDGDEIELGTDPLNLDTDGDILYDGGELVYGTDPLNPDTDGDGVSDGNEVYFLGTDPANPDTDGDGINDFNDPTPLGEIEPADDEDTSSGSAANIAAASSSSVDSDNDGLLDRQEVQFGTDPLVWDSDGDSVNDSNEVAAGTNPLDASSYP